MVTQSVHITLAFTLCKNLFIRHGKTFMKLVLPLPRNIQISNQLGGGKDFSIWESRYSTCLVWAFMIFFLQFVPQTAYQLMKGSQNALQDMKNLLCMENCSIFLKEIRMKCSFWFSQFHVPTKILRDCYWSDMHIYKKSKMADIPFDENIYTGCIKKSLHLVDVF